MKYFIITIVVVVFSFSTLVFANEDNRMLELKNRIGLIENNNEKDGAYLTQLRNELTIVLERIKERNGAIKELFYWIGVEKKEQAKGKLEKAKKKSNFEKVIKEIEKEEVVEIEDSKKITLTNDNELEYEEVKKDE